MNIQLTAITALLCLVGCGGGPPPPAAPGPPNTPFPPGSIGDGLNKAKDILASAPTNLPAGVLVLLDTVCINQLPGRPGRFGEGGTLPPNSPGNPTPNPKFVINIYYEAIKTQGMGGDGYAFCDILGIVILHEIYHLSIPGLPPGAPVAPGSNCEHLGLGRQTLNRLCDMATAAAGQMPPNGPGLTAACGIWNALATRWQPGGKYVADATACCAGGYAAPTPELDLCPFPDPAAPAGKNVFCAACP